jgi:hypothetical protein
MCGFGMWHFASERACWWRMRVWVAVKEVFEVGSTDADADADAVLIHSWGSHEPACRCRLFRAVFSLTKMGFRVIGRYGGYSTYRYPRFRS